MWLAMHLIKHLFYGVELFCTAFVLVVLRAHLPHPYAGDVGSSRTERYEPADIWPTDE